MIIKSANFVKSSAELSQCPDPRLPEYAFIGRSNVGKSSLINMITGKAKLAKTSSTPGKTQTINHFNINESWFLVDLPGYGYAKVSRTEREKWEKNLYQYLQKRENLQCVFVLIDCRLDPQKSDIDFINWLGTKGIAFVIIFTKIDKIGLVQLDKNLLEFSKELLKHWEELPPIFRSSAEKKVGRDEILGFIERVNQDFLVNK